MSSILSQKGIPCLTYTKTAGITNSNCRFSFVSSPRPCTMWDAIRNPVSERWRGRDKPPHFVRLRWWMGWQGAVEAKCGGCERGLLFQWGWHGGGAGTAGTSSQGSHRGTGFHCTGRSHKKIFLALLSSAEVVKIIRCGIKRLHGVWQAHETQPITVIAFDN
jgi:hypothetical protein